MLRKTRFFIGIILLMIATVVRAELPQAGSLLFVVQASQSEIIKVDNEYKLILHNPKVNYLADRPVRQAGHMKIQELLQFWNKGKDSFAVDNPNAAFVAEAGNSNSEHEVTRFAVLKNPQLNNKQNTLSFNIKSLTDAKDFINTGRYKNSTLFIDNCTMGDNGIGCF